MTNEELALLIQQGGADQKDLLWELYNQNSGLIMKIVFKYSGYAEFDDLRQEAFFGIRTAALLWDPDAGASFIHYAVYWIRQALQRYCDDCGGIVRVPSYQRDRIRKYKRVVNDFRVRFGRDPDGRELAAVLDLTPEQVEDVKRDVIALRIRSTSEPVTEDGETVLEDMLPAEGDDISDLIDRIQAEELQRVLWSCVDALEGREAQVIRDRYRNGHTLRECGASLGVSLEYVRAIERKAIRKLQNPKVTRQLLSFTDHFAYERGLKHSTLAAFQHDHTSSQEKAMMMLEEAEERRKQWLEEMEEYKKQWLK